MDEHNLIESLVNSLVSQASFNGIVIAYDQRGGDTTKFAFMAKGKETTDQDILHLVKNMLGIQFDPTSMTIARLVETLRDHPVFHGVIVQERGQEAMETVGHSTVQFDISHGLSRKEAASILRTAANTLDPELCFNLPLAALTTDNRRGFPLVQTPKGPALPIFDSLEDAKLFVERGALGFDVIPLADEAAIRKMIKELRKVHPNFDILYNPLDPNRINAVAFSIKTFLGSIFQRADDVPPAPGRNSRDAG